MSVVRRIVGHVKAVMSVPRDYSRQRQAMRRAKEQGWRNEREQERAALHQVWFPRLQKYADECRLRFPIPDVSAYSAAEHEQHRILQEAMQTSLESTSLEIVLRRRPNYVPVLWTSRIGLPAAQALFGDTGAVILEESEQRDWFHGVYEFDRRDWGAWWFAFAWWTLSETISEEERAAMEPAVTAPPAGITFWAQYSGVQWGELHGGQRGTLWRWDGARATFDREYSDITF